MNFTISSHKADITHGLLILGQALNLISGQVPQKYQVFVAAGLALIQLLVGKLQQNTPVPPAPTSSVSPK
jgi:hypothetical protein